MNDMENNTQPIEIRLDPGLSVRGFVTLADGVPVGGVAVTLRDSIGRLRPPERTVVSTADGSFTFTGLDADDSLVLFASQLRFGRTWSAKVRCQGGTAPIPMVRRDEDPQILPPDQRR